MSEQLDERLRTAARTYRRLGNQSAESMFLEAADTICKIQTENEKLRELLKELYQFVGDACPDDCKHREECDGEGNHGAHGFPLVCIAYNRYFEELRNHGIEAG